jgi:hypothetical protein
MIIKRRLAAFPSKKLARLGQSFATSRRNRKVGPLFFNPTGACEMEQRTLI